MFVGKFALDNLRMQLFADGIYYVYFLSKTEQKRRVDFHLQVWFPALVYTFVFDDLWRQLPRNAIKLLHVDLSSSDN